MVFKIFGVGLLCTSFLILLCGGVAVSCRVDFGGWEFPGSWDMWVVGCLRLAVSDFFKETGIMFFRIKLLTWCEVY